MQDDISPEDSRENSLNFAANNFIAGYSTCGRNIMSSSSISTV
jgi:hypothetical protein